MPMYEHKCRDCNRIFVNQSRDDTTCPMGHKTIRVFSFNIGSSFVPHFNYSIGKYVETEAQFNSELRRMSDTASAETGIEHNYQSVPLHESSAFGVTEEGQEGFEKAHGISSGTKVFYD